MDILQNPHLNKQTKSLWINFASMCKLKVVSFLFLCSKIFSCLCLCDRNHLKTLKCINKTTTLAKKKKKIYSIYNYIQKQKGKEKPARNTLPRSLTGWIFAVDSLRTLPSWKQKFPQKAESEASTFSSSPSVSFHSKLQSTLPVDWLCNFPTMHRALLV